MQITTNKFTVKQLFSSSNEQFIVPSYQRRYAWGYKQQLALFDDIDYLKEDDNHLFGMILCHTGTHTGGLNQSELVDGQQRLTTLTILLFCIKQRFEELGLRKKADEIEGLISAYDLDEVRLNKLKLGDLDNDDFEKIIKKETDEEVINRNLWDAFLNFSDWLKDFEKEKLNQFYNKLINIAVIIRLDVSFAKDAYTLFESINNRGLKLSPTDIIKNFILGHASKIDMSTLEKVKNLWSAIIINLDGIDTNQFLRQYMCMLLGRRITMRALVEGFKNYYFNHIEHADIISKAELYVEEEDESDDDFDADMDKNPEEENNGSIDRSRTIEAEEKTKRHSVIDFLQEIKEASLLYRKIRFRAFKEERINHHILNLQRILSFPSYIFLLSLFKRNIPHKVQITALELIETFMLRRHICQKRTGELDHIFAQLVSIPNKSLLDSIKETLIEHLPDDDEFIDYFPKHVFKGRLIERARYVLEQIEYYMIKDTGEFKLSSASDVHLEHIMPQTITTKKAKKEYGDWVEYLGENAISRHKRYVSRIGNLTLIAGDLNIKASNNPFNAKKQNYKQSKIKLNEPLANHYRQFKFQQIDERSKELAEIALKIWKF
jgi:uncharacterized protein with ParB-like and HNH nuclease domain